jgi:group I intron endonuclease
MLVYRVTNTINGKVYIGKTLQTAEARWAEHVYMARRNAPWIFNRAIRKYGAAAFGIEVLYTAKTENELNVMETFFIILHQSQIRENGYNMTLGGKGASGKRTPEQCRRISEGRKGIGVGQKRSPETCEKLRLSKLGNKNPNFGKPISPELRVRLMEKPTRLGTGHPSVEKTCPHCFTSFISNYENRGQVCCSKSCAAELRYKNPEARKIQVALWTPEMRAVARRTLCS